MIRANDRGLNPPPPVVEEPRRPGLVNTRNIIIVVGVVAWLAVLLLFVVPQLTRKPAPAATTAAATTQAAAGGVSAVAPKAVPSPELTIANRVFNLAGASAGFKYVKLSVVVQFADPNGRFAKAKGDSLKTLEAAFTADNPGAEAAFNDILTSTVSSKTAAELATPQGKESLRRELIGKFNSALAGTQQRVTYVIFSDFVMQ